MGFTSTYLAGMFEGLWGTVTETTRVSGGLPAYTTPTHVTNAMRKQPTLSCQFRLMKPGILTGASDAPTCAAGGLWRADGASRRVRTRLPW
jgi:hypothetical protein